MPRSHPTPDQRPDRLPALDEPEISPEIGRATASPARGTPDRVHKRQLEKSVSWSGRERLRCLWYRLRLTVAEMNGATRRMVEVQAPWIAEDRTRS